MRGTLFLALVGRSSASGGEATDCRRPRGDTDAARVRSRRQPRSVTTPPVAAVELSAGVATTSAAAPHFRDADAPHWRNDDASHRSDEREPHETTTRDTLAPNPHRGGTDR